MIEQVRQALAKQLRKNIDEVRPDSRIKADLGADSLDVMMLLMTIEEDMGIVIPDEALADFETVSDVSSYLEKVSST